MSRDDKAWFWPDAAIFDLDDTLYDYAPAHQAGLASARAYCMAELGIGAEDFDAGFAAARKTVKQRLGNTAASHDRLLYFKAMLEHLDFKLQPRLALDLDHRYWRDFLITAELVPGARDLVLMLREKMIPVAIVTDLTLSIQLRKLVYFGLDRDFDALIASEEVGADKPDDRGLREVMRRFGLTEKSRLWAFGDDAGKDLDPVRALCPDSRLFWRNRGRDEGGYAGFEDFTTLIEEIDRHQEREAAK